MANLRGKEIDNTHLSIDTAENRIMIHRDYIAHVFRWTYVARQLGGSQRYKTARILDIGCGVDLPLARMLYSNRFIVQDYVGLDYNWSPKFKLDMFERGKFPLNPYGHVDFASKQVLVRKPEFEQCQAELCLYVNGDTEEGEHELPNVFTAFEMLEHIEPGHSRATLRKIKRLMEFCQEVHGEDPVAFISTPCYDAQVGEAANHVNEIKRDALGAMLEDLGFVITDNFGTFASQRDYRDKMLAEHPEWTEFWKKCHQYYDSNMLANIFAPLYPQYSRNNIWVLRLPDNVTKYERKFPPLAGVPTPWTSSARWAELASDDAYKMEI